MPNFGMSIGLGIAVHMACGSFSAYDPSAAVYIAAVETAKGSPMTGTQRTAIDDFIRAEKLAGRWSSLRRLFLPIWGNAGANAICMVTGATGTFINSPTHGAGFVQGNGSSSYFDMGVDPASLGLTTASGMMGHLSDGGGSGTAFGNLGCGGADLGVSAMVERWINTLGIDFFYCDIGGGLLRQGASTIDSNYGVVACTRFGGVREIARRGSGGVSILATATNANSGAVPTQNVFCMVFSQAGTPVGGFSNIRYGAFFLSLGMDSTNRDGFTLNLKNVYETCTALALPA